jgi:vancomycin resistance protein YoaR
VEYNPKNTINILKDKKKIVIIVLLSALLIGAMSYFISGLFSGTNGNKKTNSLLNEIAIKGNKDDLKKELSQKIEKANNNEITLNAKGKGMTFKFSDISVEYDLEKTIKAYSDGNVSKSSNKTKDKIFLYNEEKLGKILNDFQNESCEKATDFVIEDKEKSVLIGKGKQGEEIDKDKAVKNIEEKITNIKSASVDLEVKKVKPKYDVEALYKCIFKKGENATVKSTGTGYTIVPHVMGRDVNKSLLKTVLEKFETSDEKQEVAITLVTPEITSDILQSRIFKDVLSSYSTQFSSSSQGRATNVILAAKKVNGVVIAPGGSFSYNGIVGSTSKAEGFQEAAVYSGGEITTGVGGGICQVSTTLHNVVLKIPDLKITSRTNHSFTVSYVPPGYDAAVSYGSLDYRFVNNSKWPVKINASTGGGTLAVSISGTKDNNKIVTLSTAKVRDVPFKTVYKDDPALTVGVEQVKNSPKDGLVIDTYRTVTENGVTLSSGKIYSSNYSAYDKVIIKGTKAKSDTSTSSVPAANVTPTAVPTNPPDPNPVSPTN